MTPYQKLTVTLLGEKPKRGTMTRLASRLGMWKQSICITWRKVPGSNYDRIIPCNAAGRIEAITNGEVTADEIREFAHQHRSDSEAA
ncbi:hypothetical protein [Endozoicomonas sp. Mp262]|uniref:hypothetical protein n=1 Tax=Endozoicomonas sp. Mp262 TaxID=2919499 RepID=UPI0021D967E5